MLRGWGGYGDGVLGMREGVKNFEFDGFGCLRWWSSCAWEAVTAEYDCKLVGKLGQQIYIW